MRSIGPAVTRRLLPCPLVPKYRVRQLLGQMELNRNKFNYIQCFSRVGDCPECHPAGLFIRNFSLVAIIPLGGLQTLLSTKPVAKQSAYISKKFITLEEKNPLIWFKPGLEFFFFFFLSKQTKNSQNRNKANQK